MDGPSVEGKEGGQEEDFPPGERTEVKGLGHEIHNASNLYAGVSKEGLCQFSLSAEKICIVSECLPKFPLLRSPGADWLCLPLSLDAWGILHSSSFPSTYTCSLILRSARDWPYVAIPSSCSHYSPPFPNAGNKWRPRKSVALAYAQFAAWAFKSCDLLATGSTVFLLQSRTNKKFRCILPGLGNNIRLLSFQS